MGRSRVWLAWHNDRAYDWQVSVLRTELSLAARLIDNSTLDACRLTSNRSAEAREAMAAPIHKPANDGLPVQSLSKADIRSPARQNRRMSAFANPFRARREEIQARAAQATAAQTRLTRSEPLATR